MRKRNHSRERFSRNLAFLGGCCLLVTVGVIWRMHHLQVVQGEAYRDSSRRVKCKPQTELAYRGPIIDRHGVVLATTITSSKAAMAKGYIYDASHAPLLAPLLEMDIADLDARLRSGGPVYRYLQLRVDAESSTEIAKLRLPGIVLEPTQRRAYPQGPTAAHVIGFANIDAKGQGGIEGYFNEEIRGSSVKVEACRDARGRVFFRSSDDTGLNRGGTVHLTLDATLQSIAEAELGRQVETSRAAAGAVVMMDPKTGEILALANHPTYDPNQPGDSPADARRNRIVMDLLEPGSTIKPFIVAAAMEEGLVHAEDTFFCENGRMRVEGRSRPITDTKSYGDLDVTDVIRVSSNICSVKIGWKVGPQLLHEYLRAFGFGRTSSVELPGEHRGTLTDPSRWKKSDTASVSFGYGMAVTALQLASAYATIANDGVRMQPRIVRKITDQFGGDIREFPLQEERRVIRPEVARELRRMMHTVVGPTGTARRAQIDGVPAAGKTGTARKVQEGGGYGREYTASFAGFFPVEDPRVVIVVIVDDPKGEYYGGAVAGPVFKAIAESSLDYLGVEKELPPPSGEIDRLFPSGPLPGTQQAAVPAEEPEQPEGTMPNLHGLPLRTAMRALAGHDVQVRIEGHGFVVSHDPPAGQMIEPSSPVSLKLAASL